MCRHCNRRATVAMAMASWAGLSCAPLFGDGGGNQSTEWTGNLLFDSDKPTTPSVKISGGADRKAVLANNLVVADPLFVAPGTGADADFRLEIGSPAIGTAVAASAATTDLLRRMRNERPCIGAYEFGAKSADRSERGRVRKQADEQPIHGAPKHVPQ